MKELFLMNRSCLELYMILTVHLEIVLRYQVIKLCRLLTALSWIEAMSLIICNSSTEKLWETKLQKDTS